MDSRLKKTAQTLSSFLEEDLSPVYLGISEAARAQLNHFREFLYEFYSQKFGSWPPRSIFSKSIFKSMHSDFRNLYDYLVDLESSPSLSEKGLASGSISVLQILQAFDRRHNYQPLSHLLPQLPNNGGLRRSSSKKALDSFRLSVRKEIDPKSNVFTTAANSTNLRIINSPVVKAFQQFEIVSMAENSSSLSLTDARRTHWIIVYCTLQMLISATRAPEAVQDVDSPTYALCCDTHGIPPWRTEPPPRHPSPTGESSRVPLSINALMQGTPLTRPDTSKSPPMSPRSPASSDFSADSYIKPADIAIPTWRDVLSMRDPSTVAFKELQKQMDTSKTEKSKKKSASKAGPSSQASTSRYSLNLLSSKKTNEKERLREKERAKIPPPPGSSMARKGSSSTGHSSQSIKSGSLSGRVDSVRSADRSTDALSKITSRDTAPKVASREALPRKYSSGKHVDEPRSPDKGDVAPWEAMEPTMSGAIDSRPTTRQMELRPSSKTSKLSKEQGSHSRAKSIPLVPSG
jgi:hypothetical protein